MVLAARPQVLSPPFRRVSFYFARPGLRALRVAPPSPYRGQRQRPGKAGPAVFLEGVVRFF